jgi:hypothetical protein
MKGRSKCDRESQMIERGPERASLAATRLYPSADPAPERTGAPATENDVPVNAPEIEGFGHIDLLVTDGERSVR